MEDTLILLRFNCPDSDCDYIGNGWGDLRLHARATHGKLMWFVYIDSVSPCCINNIFTATFVSDIRKSFLMNIPCTHLQP